MELRKPWSSKEFLLPTKIASPLKTKAAQRMKLDIQETSDGILSIFLWNPDEIEYEDSNKTKTAANSSSVWNVFSPEVFIEIKRRGNNKTMFSTARGPLIASENYFEWSIYLNSAELMGFDELQLKEGHRILISNERSSVAPYVIAFGRCTAFPIS